MVRIGGDSTDTTWWPTRSLLRSGGLSFGLTPRWIAVARSLALAVHAHLILGVNLNAEQPQLAAAEARALLFGIGATNVEALEIGNEPALYPAFPWYRTRRGKAVFARRPGYGFASFRHEFASVATLMPRTARLAGPTLGGPDWMGDLARFTATEPRLGLVTLHQYPFNRCFSQPGSPTYPTVTRLLSRYGSRGVEPALTRYVDIARHDGLALRLDETNSVSCGGKRGVSDTFASALWALDSLFALARIGVVGVNFHSFPGAAYELFRFRLAHGRWSATVAPVYYGMLMFAQAAPPGSRLLRLTTTGSGNLRAWSTRATDGTLRVVLINDDLSRRHVVLVRASARFATATTVSLTAPSPYARGGVEYGGRSFGIASTGLLSRPAATHTLASGPGRYLITVAPASAAMLTLAPVLSPSANRT